jgi:hypothetical protein
VRICGHPPFEKRRLESCYFLDIWEMAIPLPQLPAEVLPIW